MKISKKIKQFYKWYIKGEYHCDHCPYAWEECSYEGDCDCGCHIKGDIHDTCRLFPPFKTIKGKIRIRQNEYTMCHEYDGFEEWNETNEEQGKEFNRLLTKWLEQYELCYKNHDGSIAKDKNDNIIFANKDSLIESESWRIRYDFQDFITPPTKTLRKEWGDLIKRTWHRFVRPILPFLPRRSRQKRRGK